MTTTSAPWARSALEPDLGRRRDVETERLLAGVNAVRVEFDGVARVLGDHPLRRLADGDDHAVRDPDRVRGVPLDVVGTALHLELERCRAGLRIEGAPLVRRERHGVAIDERLTGGLADRDRSRPGARAHPVDHLRSRGRRLGELLTAGDEDERDGREGRQGSHVPSLLCERTCRIARAVSKSGRHGCRLDPAALLGNGHGARFARLGGPTWTRTRNCPVMSREL